MLKAYLEASLPLMTRPVSHGIEQSQLFEAVRSAWDVVQP